MKLFKPFLIYLLLFISLLFPTKTFCFPLQPEMVRVVFGARYDDVRMCVATPKDTKGGPAGDIAFNYSLKRNDNGELLFTLPVFRPVFFALSFDMLQFEPDITWISQKNNNWNWGIGFGSTFHYGPDYKSDKKDRGEDFWAFGPKLLFLVNYNEKYCLSTYCSPLFSNDYRHGNVIGFSFEYWFLKK